MRFLLLLSVTALVGAVPLSAAPSPRVLSAAGVHVVVPAGWQARAGHTPQCDPRRLLVASSGRLRARADGGIASPRPDEVIVVLLEDLLVQDRPSGDLRRPRHFTIDWAGVRRRAPDGYCGDPLGPASMQWFETGGRYLGFTVFPGTHVGAAARAQTLVLMDSLRVSR